MSKPSRRPRAGRRSAEVEGMAPQLLEVGRVSGRHGLPLFLTWRAFRTLCEELGGHDQAWAFVGRLATESGKPVFCNGPRRDGAEGSTTVAIPPADPSWTQERLCGYFAGMKDDIAEMFGGIDGPPTWPGKTA